MIMKRNEEIVSLNVVHFEQKEEMSLSERLEKLTSVAMKKVVAGGDSTCPTNCPSKQGCGSECVTECVGRCDMFGCSYDHPGGWVDPCGSFGDCMIMDDCMTMNELT